LQKVSGFISWNFLFCVTPVILVRVWQSRLVNEIEICFPKEELVIVVINTLPFKLENNIGIDATRSDVRYDYEQYKRLTAHDNIFYAASVVM
jgi:hypothetical protein